MSYSFFITSLIVILLPGTGAIYTISNGLTRGKKTSLYSAIGCTLGIIPHLTIGILSLSLLYSANTRFITTIQLIGALYLLYLGIKMIKSNDIIKLNPTHTTYSNVNIIIKGIFINLLNPKLTLFFISFLPQFISSSSSNILFQSVLLGVIFMLMTLIIFSLYGLLAGILNSYLLTSQKTLKIITQLFGFIFIGFAIKLVI